MRRGERGPGGYPEGASRGPGRGAQAAVVVAARRGSSRAFVELYVANAGWVAQMARNRASRDENVVADIVQEVFTRALENLGQLRDPNRFAAWLRSITAHVIVDHHRVAGRSRPLDDESAHEIASSGAAPDELAEAHELARLLRQSVDGLSLRDATAIRLSSGSDGLSPGELGAELGVSRGAAKVILHRARTRLRAALRVKILQERRLSDCPVLGQLLGEGEMMAAARHIDGCPRCARAAEQIEPMRSARRPRGH